jgi:hypothetical protein
MRGFIVRAAVVLSIAGMLAVSTPLLASAGSNSSSKDVTTSALRTYNKELAAYRDSRRAIQLTFRAAVSSAKSAYSEALSLAVTAAQRSTAQQNETTAIILAAQARSAALIALGSQPVKP